MPPVIKKVSDMKKCFLIILILVLLFLLPSQAYSASGVSENIPLYILGDTDIDGEVSIIDATVILRENAGLAVLSYCETAADADENGEVNVIDATVIQYHLASLEVNENVGKRFYDVDDIQKYTDDLIEDLLAYLEEENAIISSNKFDKSAYEASVMLNDEGDVITDASYVSTGYIHCRKGQKYSRNRGL